VGALSSDCRAGVPQRDEAARNSRKKNLYLAKSVFFLLSLFYPQAKELKPKTGLPNRKRVSGKPDADGTDVALVGKTAAWPGVMARAARRT